MVARETATGIRETEMKGEGTRLQKGYWGSSLSNKIIFLIAGRQAILKASIPVTARSGFILVTLRKGS